MTNFDQNTPVRGIKYNGDRIPPPIPCAAACLREVARYGGRCGLQACVARSCLREGHICSTPIPKRENARNCRGVAPSAPAGFPMRKPKKYGRKHTLQRWMIDEVVAALRDDRVSLGGAARRIKVPEHTLYTWVQRGRTPDGTPLERELAARVDDVLYQLESMWAQGFEYAKDWPRYKELLKARFPMQWGSLFQKQQLSEEPVEISE